MNSLDVILLTIIIVFTIRGIFRGLITELIVLTAIIGGIIISFSLLEAGTAVLLHFFPKLPVFAARVAAFAAIFVIVNILLRALGRILNQIVKKISLKSVNRLAGGIFGCIKIMLILSLILIMFDYVLLTLNNFLPVSGRVLEFIGAEESFLYQPIKHFAPQVYTAVVSIFPGTGEIHRKVIEALQSAETAAKSVMKPY